MHHPQAISQPRRLLAADGIRSGDHARHRVSRRPVYSYSFHIGSVVGGEEVGLQLISDSDAGVPKTAADAVKRAHAAVHRLGALSKLGRTGRLCFAADGSTGYYNAALTRCIQRRGGVN